MIRYLLVLIIFVGIGRNASAQQDLQVSQFFNNKLLYNPAVSGTEQALSIKALYRNQWVGISGHPISQLLSADLPLYNINSGAGIYFTNDQIGFYRDMSLKATYSYQIKLGAGIFSAGLNAGVIQKKLDGAELKAPQGNYDPDPGTIDHNDPFIPASQISGMAPDLGLGAYYFNDRYSVGVAVKHILNPVISLEMLAGASMDFAYTRHYLVHSQYLISLNDKIDLQPAVLVKSDFVKHQLDLNAIFFYDENFWVGIGYRGYNNTSNDALIGMAGLKLSNNWMFGYSYDYNVSGLNKVNSGSHELSVNYKISIERPRKGKVINNPRFLSF